MFDRVPSGFARGGQLVGAVALWLMFPACVAVRPGSEVEVAIARHLLVDEPVSFRVEGGPLDEPASASEGTLLTLADATRMAVATDPALQAALARVRIAMADADQARLLPNPVLNFVLRWGPESPHVEVSLAQDIIEVFRIPRRASAADNRLRQSTAAAVTVALDVAAEVQEKYATAQAAGRLIPVLEGRLSLVHRLVDVAKSRLDAGEGARGDVTALDAQRVELEVELADARLSLRKGQVHLARLIGRPSSEAKWTLDQWAVLNGGAGSEQDWIVAALGHRPEVQARLWHLAALGDESAMTRMIPWEGVSIGADVQRDADVHAGPSISTPIPIFDMGQARAARATAEQVEARHDLTLAQRVVVQEVRLAHAALAGNLANLSRVRDGLIPLQRLRREQAEQAHRAGQADVTALYLAEQDLRTAQVRLIELERDASISLIRLQRAVGGRGIARSIESPVSPVSVAPPCVPTPGEHAQVGPQSTASSSAQP